MKRIINVAKVQYVNTGSMLWVPAIILLGSLAISLAIFALVPEAHYSGGVNAPLWYFLAMGIQGMTLFFPFSQALGVTRREFALGSFLTAGVFSTLLGLIVVLGGLLEQATNGWGLGGYFFYLPWMWANGPLGAWLLFTVLAWLLYITGFSLAALYKRFGGLALTVAIVVLALLLVGAAWLLTTTDSWMTMFSWFQGFGPLSTAGALVGVCAVIGAGSYLTLRRMVVR